MDNSKSAVSRVNVQEKQQHHKPKTRWGSLLAKFFVYLAALITLGALIFVVVYVFMRGVPYLTPEIFSLQYNSKNVSMFPSIVNTLQVIAITLAISIPVGIATAIYTVEYAKPGNKFVEFVRLMTETLQGIPSIIFGLFGMLFFAYTIGWNMAILSGAMTMAMMCLPVIVRATEEALMAVPNSLREASYGLGARKVRTIFVVVLPAASLGIISGIVLAIGRIVGETAALIYTAGTMANLAGPMDNGRTLAVHMYMLQTESLHRDQAFATAAVLLVIVALINIVSMRIEGNIKKRELGNG